MTPTTSPHLGQIHALLAEQGYEVSEPAPDTIKIREVDSGVSIQAVLESDILFLSLPLYALDQLTKQLVLRSINPYDARVVVSDFFNLVNVTNTGAAFGSFKGNNTFFIIISVIALVVVTVLLVRHRRVDSWRDVSLALLLAGILGNLTDRLLYGHVIDFLLFNLHIRYADPWPAFNVADSCISIAVVLFIIHSFQRQKSTG